MEGGFGFAAVGGMKMKNDLYRASKEFDTSTTHFMNALLSTATDLEQVPFLAVPAPHVFCVDRCSPPKEW